MRWHPDRQADRSAAAIEAAAFRMQELNAAWAVLRNPARRAAYDDRLAGRDSPGRAAGSGAPAPGATSAAGPLPPLVSPGRGPAAAPSPVPWGCLGVVLACVVLALVVTAYAASNRPRSQEIDVEVREPFAVGSCVRLVERTGPGPAGEVAVVEVLCEDPHDAVVRERTTFPKPCPQGTTAVVLGDRATQVCLGPP